MRDQTDDRAAIIDLAVAYGQAVDDGDFDALRNLFTVDATAELGGSGQTGIDEICARLSAALSPYLRWEHHLGDHEVAIDGDTATARCSVHAIHFRREGESPPIYTVVGAYEDRLLRTGAGWRITHRSLVVTHRD